MMKFVAPMDTWEMVGWVDCWVSALCSFVAPMDTWEMVGGNLPPIRVRARSFDEALKKARLRNPGYCAGWVVEEG